MGRLPAGLQVIHKQPVLMHQAYRQPIADGGSGERFDFGFLAKRGQRVAVGLLPEITPFPSAQILLAGLGPLAVEQILSASQVAPVKRLHGHVHVRGVGPPAGGEFGGFGLTAGLIGLFAQFGFVGLGFDRLRLGGQGFAFGARGQDRLPGADDDAEQQSRGNGENSGENQPVPAKRFLKLVGRARGTGQDRLVVEMALEIERQAIGRFVSARAVFLHTLHHDPIQVALELVKELRCFG